MRALWLLPLLVASTAHAQTIFPAGGKVPPTPTIWISGADVPAITVHDEGGDPVLFHVDEMKLEHGIHRIAIYPQLDLGSKFVVTAGKTRAAFEVVDLSPHGVAADVPEVDVDLKRVGVERRGTADVLVIDAKVVHGTIMYLLNQEHHTLDHDPGYLWVGEGDTSKGLTRFTIPLSDFGASCASDKTIEFSPYTQGLDKGATLYPIARLQIARGKIRLPLSIVGDFDTKLEDQPWLPCPGASLFAPPAPPAAIEPTQPTDDEHDGWISCHTNHEIEPVEPPHASPPIDDVPPTESRDTIAWIQVMVVLFGALLVMWRATAKIGL